MRWIPPSPDIKLALVNIESAKEALSVDIRNKSQLQDAIRTAEFFLSLAKEKVLT